ncbi:MAG: hypothetical protein GY833_22880 [Aestuariibacter sp.]|nr:hypothetical protein [Aestuariibacter sp.]|tara:strand:- start:195948 stop:196676 length:729 start_codon:yes stop_codon:yes gene_type:complete
MKLTIANELPPLPNSDRLVPMKQAPSRLVRSNGTLAIVKDPYQDEHGELRMDVLCLLEHKISKVKLKGNGCGICFQKGRLHYLKEFDSVVAYTEPTHSKVINLAEVEDDVMTLLSEFYTVGDGFDIAGITLPISADESADDAQALHDLFTAPKQPLTLIYHITPLKRTNKHNRTLEVRYSVATRCYSLRYLVSMQAPTVLSLKLDADTAPNVVRNFLMMALAHFDDALDQDHANPAGTGDAA